MSHATPLAAQLLPLAFLLAGSLARALCVAVGSSSVGALAVVWRGAGWSLMKAPATPAGTVTMSGICCPSIARCVAVGTLAPASGSTSAPAPLALVWNGSTWKLQYPPAGNGDSQLTGVWCPAARLSCAVGSYGASPVDSRRQSALIAFWNGSTWSSVTLPGTVAATGRLTGVACAGTRSCGAVTGGTSTVGYLGVALAWNGSAWTTVAATIPHTALGWLDGVASKLATRCTAVTAVGVSMPSASQYDSLALTGTL